MDLVDGITRACYWPWPSGRTRASRICGSGIEPVGWPQPPNPDGCGTTVPGRRDQRGEPPASHRDGQQPRRVLASDGRHRRPLVHRAQWSGRRTGLPRLRCSETPSPSGAARRSPRPSASAASRCRSPSSPPGCRAVPVLQRAQRASRARDGVHPPTLVSLRVGVDASTGVRQRVRTRFPQPREP